MDWRDESDLERGTRNMFTNGGTPNVLDALIAMAESQLVILKKLKEIVSRTGD